MRFLIITLSIFILSCSTSDDSDPQSDIVKIGYGISFGECLGYCIRTLTIDQDSIQFVKSGWTIDSLLSDIACSDPTDDFSALTGEVDFIQFLQLDSIIGCPDCADGGAEWIELTSGDNRHKVVFDYLHPPLVLEDITSDLRALMEGYERCTGD